LRLLKPVYRIHHADGWISQVPCRFAKEAVGFRSTGRRDERAIFTDWEWRWPDGFEWQTCPSDGDCDERHRSVEGTGAEVTCRQPNVGHGYWPGAANHRPCRRSVRVGRGDESCLIAWISHLRSEMWGTRLPYLFSRCCSRRSTWSTAPWRLNARAHSQNRKTLTP